MCNIVCMCEPDHPSIVSGRMKFVKCFIMFQPKALYEFTYRKVSIMESQHQIFGVWTLFRDLVHTHTCIRCRRKKYIQHAYISNGGRWKWPEINITLTTTTSTASVVKILWFCKVSHFIIHCWTHFVSLGSLLECGVAVSIALNEDIDDDDATLEYLW